MWQRDLDGDENIIGRTISLDKMPFTVIGVMPPDYLQSIEPRVRYWRPLDDFGRGGGVLGRLAPDSAGGDGQRLSGAFDRILQNEASDHAVSFVPLQERLVGSTRSSLWLLMGGVSALFLVAILNLTNLTFAHFFNRIHELTTRTSLGATRSRLIGQLVAENLLLSGIAAVSSVFLTAGLLDAVLLMMPDTFPRKAEIALDLWPWGFAVILAVASVLLVMFVPCARIANPARLIEQMKHGGHRLVDSFGSVRLRRHLIAAQVGVALTLLVGVGLLLRSYVNLLNQDVGFDADRVFTGHIWRPEGLSDGEISSKFERVLSEIRGLPEVGLVAAGSTIPVGPMPTRVDPTVRYTYSGQPPLGAGQETRVALRTVTDDFFRVLGIPLVSGRFFDGRERTSGNRTLIVNEAMAEAVWPGLNAVGRELTLTRRGGDVVYTIVGVTENYRFEGLYADAKPEAFLSMSQEVFGGASFIAKIGTDDAATTMQAISSIVSRLDNSMPMIEVHMMDDLVHGSVSGQQSLLRLVLGFGFFATLLAGVGIYGLTSYLIGRRTREIAVRIALGADRAWIGAWVMKEALIPAFFGIGLGLVLAAASIRLLAGFLFGIGTWDWQAYSGALLIIVLVSILAPIGPALRAARVRPNDALRAE